MSILHITPITGLLFLRRGLVSEEGQEDVVTNLDRVDVKKTLAGWDKGKVLSSVSKGKQGKKQFGVSSQSKQSKTRNNSSITWTCNRMGRHPDFARNDVGKK